MSGRVIDVQTGRTLRRVPREKITHETRGELYPDIRVGDDAWLRARSGEAANHFVRGELRLRLFRDDGSVRWEFDVASTEKHFHGYRYCPPSERRRPFVYLLVSDGPNTKPHSTKHYALPNLTSYHLLTLDVHEGQLVQEVPLGLAIRECRIEDVDETALLISTDGKRLRYFERVTD